MKLKKTALSVVTIVIAATPTYAFAAQSQDNIAGYVSYSPLSTDPGITSISADISTPVTYQDVFSPSGSPSYVMISNGASGSAYAQVGWTKENGTSPSAQGVHYFYEQWNGTGNPYDQFNAVGPANGSEHTYRVSYDASSGNFIGYEDTAQIGGTTKSWQGVRGYFAEEIFGDPDTNAAFAGTKVNHTRFGNMRVFYNNVTKYSPVAASDWYTTNSDGAYDTSFYTSGSQSATIDMWDTRK